jgi:anti-sigma B factor antagonist
VNPQQFQIDVRRERESARVLPIGELDLATVGRLDRALGELRGDGVRRVVVDLRGLTFMDSTGLSLLLRWGHDADRDGFDLALVHGGRPIRRLFELTGAEGRLTFVDPEA